MRRVSLLFLLVAAAVAQQSMTPEAFWRDLIKAPLMKPNAPRLFEETYKHALLPGPAFGIRFMRGVVVSSTPADAPTQIDVAMSDRTTPEARLVFFEGESLRGRAMSGTTIEFEGIAQTFQREPFLIVFEVEEGSVRVPQ